MAKKRRNKSSDPYSLSPFESEINRLRDYAERQVFDRVGISRKKANDLRRKNDDKGQEAALMYERADELIDWLLDFNAPSPLFLFLPSAAGRPEYRSLAINILKQAQEGFSTTESYTIQRFIDLRDIIEGW